MDGIIITIVILSGIALIAALYWQLQKGDGLKNDVVKRLGFTVCVIGVILAVISISSLIQFGYFSR